MGYEAMGRLHAMLCGALARVVEDRRGQGTVEYVGLMLLLGVLLAGVVTAARAMDQDTSIAEAITTKLEEAIDEVGSKPPGRK